MYVPNRIPFIREYVTMKDQGIIALDYLHVSHVGRPS